MALNSAQNCVLKGLGPPGVWQRVENDPARDLLHTTVYEYNLQGRKTYEGGGTYLVRFTYDDEGRMTGMTTYRDESGPGDTTAWVYDPATGLLVQKLYEDGKGPSYTYTPDGKLATRTWARGVVTSYTYDDWGNLTNIVHSDGTPSVSMVYDVMGRQIQTSDAAGVTAFAYDAFSSLTNETVNGQYTKSLDRHVDGYGRNVGYSLDGQRKQTVAYDPATGRVATMDGFAWQYLPGTDLKQSLAYPGGAVAEWVYEPRRDLLTLVSNDVFSAYAYENDTAGRRISKNTERYGYNVRGELIAATNTAPVAHYAYTFDDIGNRVVADELGTNIAYTANALNQYTNIVAEAAFTPVFDADGNQTLVKTSTGIWHVAYNAENRPVVWSNEAAVVTMDFDRMGRRVWYKSATDGQTKEYAKFVYDGYLCVQQLDGVTGTVEQEFVWDPTETIATRPLKWHLPPQDRTFFYFHDGNKNVSDVVDTSDGSLAAHYEYAPFGAVTAATGPLATINPFRFSSEYHDDELGCVYYNYRHYNPLDGRWTSRDFIEEKSGFNTYAHCANSPTDETDLVGLSVDPIALAYGEIGSCVLTLQEDKDGKRKYVTNSGIADAKASLAAVAARNSKVFTMPRPSDPVGQQAWGAIENATGGSDNSGGAKYYCINQTPPCGNKSYCYTCRCSTVTNAQDVVSVVWKREKKERQVINRATLTVGSCNIYFYDFNFEGEVKGWCTQKDFNDSKECANKKKK